MNKWADYFISQVNYTSEHLISVALRHQETEQGITKGKPIDRLTIASDIKNGLIYITIYSGKNSWKKGHPIQTFSIEGTPYLRIDGNKVKLDYLGDIQEFTLSKSQSTAKLESHQESITEPETPSPRGSLPKHSTEDLPQELDLVPESITEPEDEEVTLEQLARLEQLQKQIKKLESHQESITEPETPSPRGSLPKHSTEDLPQELDLVPESITEPEDEEVTLEQLARLEQLQKQIKKLESHQESITEPETPSPRGSLPKHSTEDLPQELDLVPESITEPEDEEVTLEQLARLEQLQKQIKKLESHQESITEPETPSPRGSLPKHSTEDLPQELDLVPESITEPETQLNDLQQQIDNLEIILSTKRNLSEDVFVKQITTVNKSENSVNAEIEQKIIFTLQKQNQKLDDIEKKLRELSTKKTIKST